MAVDRQWLIFAERRRPVSGRMPEEAGGKTMVTGRSLFRAVGSTTGGLVVALALGLAEVAVATESDRVIQLTQTGCQFLEPENGIDRGFQPRSADDCNRLNTETGDQRLANAEILELAPGAYIFRVTNTDVPYELGFWLRDADYQLGNPLHKLTKVSVSGGGLEEGQTQEYAVELEPGEYLYSCPLNPTPNYKLVVRG
jgi:hypothetical protein